MAIMKFRNHPLLLAVLLLLMTVVDSRSATLSVGDVDRRTRAGEPAAAPNGYGQQLPTAVHRYDFTVAPTASPTAYELIGPARKYGNL